MSEPLIKKLQERYGSTARPAYGTPKPKAPKVAVEAKREESGKFSSKDVKSNGGYDS